MVAYEALVLEKREFKPFEYNSESEEIYENITQFYPNMRFPESRISYSISEDCNIDKVNDIKSALDILSRNSILTFYQTDANAEIEYICSELAPESDKKNYYVAGEGGPKEIIDSGLFHVILSGKVSLYRDEKCDEPKVAIHETLHALGFDHNDNPDSILYPVTSCDEEVDEYIYRDINEIYSIPSLADISISRISAQRYSRYLSFEIDVINQGLKNSGLINLDVHADGEIVRSFDIEELGVGYKKIITVQNLKIPYNSESITFSVNLKSGAGEIDYSNNDATIVMQEL
jgi:hypothetical protein